MNFKKKRSVWELLKASLVVLFGIGVPVWVFMIGLITGSAWAWAGLLLWVSLCHVIGRRFE